MKTLLTIAGFDPSSGAGVTADLAVFAAHGCFRGFGYYRALRLQSTVGVRRTETVDAGLLRDTLDCLAEDFELAGIKIGMLTTAVNVAVVADFLAGRAGLPVVLDPVLVSSSGHALLEPAGLATLRERLLPLATWITPNRQEFAALGPPPEGLNAVVTGGDDDAADCVLMGREETWLRAAKIESRATHGTGCAFSSALLCGLVSGLNGVEAARNAKDYVRQAILRAPSLGHGRGPLALGRTL